MARTRTIFFRAVQSFLKLKNSLRRWISLLLISALIFSGCLITSRINAQVPIVKQNQQKLSTSGLVDRGREYYKNKQYNKAIETWQQALNIYQNNQNKKDTLHQAMVLSYISLGYQKQTNWNQAKQAINKSLDLLPDKNQLDKSKEKLQINAQILNTNASLELAFGEYQKALKTWQKATQIYQQLGDEIGVTGSLINQAQAMEALGLYKRSCTTLLGVFDFDNEKCEISDSQLEEALLLAQKPGNTRLISALRSLGDNLRLVNELERSEELLQGIFKIASSNNIDEIRLSLGSTERALYRKNQDLYERSKLDTNKIEALNKAEKSLESYEQTFTTKSKNIPAEILVRAKLNHFGLLLELKEWLQKLSESETDSRVVEELEKVNIKIQPIIPELVKELAKEESLFSKLTPIQEVYTVIDLSRKLIDFQYRSSQSSSNIKEALIEAQSKARQLKNQRAESYAAGNLGYYYEITDENSEAQEYTERALRIAQSIQAWDIVYQLQQQLGRIYEAKRDTQKAIIAYDSAVKTIDSVRQNLASNSSESLLSFSNQVEPVYNKLINLYLEQPKVNRNLNNIIDVNRRFQLSELENYLNCDLADSANLENFVRQENKEAIAIVYMMVLEKQDKLVVVVHSSEDKKIHSPKTPISWKKDMKGIIFSIQNTLGLDNIEESHIDGILKDTEEMYQLLINPIKKYLPKKDGTLVFVLDSQLQNIPMALLHDENNRYLMEDYNITVALGSQIKRQNKLRWSDSRALLAGVSEKTKDFKGLTNVPKELKIVANKTVGNDKKLLNKTFTKNNFETQVKNNPYPIIHLATHGKFSSNPEETFILTYDDNKNLKLEDFENLFKSRSQNRSDTIELLVLSACQTAKGDKRAGLGIAGIATQAGARSTLASLWNIDDYFVPFFMKYFYQALKDGKNKAQALRYAQIACLTNANNDPNYKDRYKKPYYWSAFILVGSWL